MLSNKKRDYEVGRGKPPVHSRFPKGKSGNPSGRKKRKKQLPDLESTMFDALSERVTITVNGEARQISKYEAICKQIVNKGASGHIPTIKILIPFLSAMTTGDANSQVDMTGPKERLRQMIMGIDARKEAEAVVENKKEHGPPNGGPKSEPSEGGKQ